MTGVVKEISQNKVILDTASGLMSVQCPNSNVPVVGESWLLGIRPEDVEIQVDIPAGSGNFVKGKVVTSQYLGEVVLYRVAVGETVFQVRSHHRNVVDPVESVLLRLPEEYCIAVQPDEASKPKINEAVKTTV
jgi:ABC-type Fe3+/spermidine/putrescine transport system ATPase subunit